MLSSDCVQCKHKRKERTMMSDAQAASRKEAFRATGSNSRASSAVAAADDMTGLLGAEISVDSRFFS